MMQPTILDSSPRALADTLDAMAQSVMGSDRETAGILAHTRERLLCLGASRWAAQVNWRSERRAMRRALKLRHTMGRYGHA
jgi:hypothetical protein